MFATPFDVCLFAFERAAGWPVKLKNGPENERLGPRGGQRSKGETIRAVGDVKTRSLSSGRRPAHNAGEQEMDGRRDER